MPRRSDKPKAAVEVNPQFANRPGVEVVEPIPPLTPENGFTYSATTTQQATVERISNAVARRALDELAELLRNGQQMTAQGMASVLRDASVRVVALRLLLGL